MATGVIRMHGGALDTPEWGKGASPDQTSTKHAELRTSEKDLGTKKKSLCWTDGQAMTERGENSAEEAGL
jgi:hypothetical protein